MKMNNRTVVLAVFILIACIQIFIPAKMILDREDILSTGRHFKFRTEPIDPNDPFRGKYVSLSYRENSILIQNEEEWDRNEIIFVQIAMDKNGYAKIVSVTKSKPSGTSDFVKAKVDYVQNTDSLRLYFEYPFNRYYMEESKAPMAELAYNETLVDTNNITYGLVAIKEGESVLIDVLINDTSIREIVKERNSKPN